MGVCRPLLLLTMLISVVYGVEDLEEEYMHPSFREDLLGSSLPPLARREGEDTNEFWLNLGQEFVDQQKNLKRNTNMAQNVLMFLGDGMSLTTLVAARNYIDAEYTKLSFEEFPYVGLAKTYSIDKIVADSGATATAYLGGIKANYGTIGVNGAVLRGDCQAMKEYRNHVYSIAKSAMDSGMSAGFVTTTRITHASPAGLYAHTADKDWESNTDIEKACGAEYGLDDIAHQLIYGEVGSKLKVIMGGGKSAFIDKSLYSKGWRSDGRNLIAEYQKQTPKNIFVDTKEQLENLDFRHTERLLGIFADDHLDYHLESQINPDNNQPTLEEMTRKAIEFMQQQDEGGGYFLFIEGGKIDVAHHDTMAHLALDETKEFSQAVNLARQLTDEDDTLIVVTSDHSSSFSVAGYQNRGTDIFSLIKNADDGVPYEPLSYANGKGYGKHFDVTVGKRVNPEEVLTGQPNDLFPATVPLTSETHGGEDVAVFASGPWSHLFTGVYEQNTIPHMMAYAACIGEGLKACEVL